MGQNLKHLFLTRHRLPLLIFCFVVATAGVGLGITFGRWIAAQLAIQELQMLTAHRLNIDIETSRQAHEILDLLEHSPAVTPCSEEELKLFLAQLYKATYIKDVGRIRDGKIECSAIAGRSPEVSENASPAYTNAFGSVTYQNLPPIADAGSRNHALQVGHSFVILEVRPALVEGAQRIGYASHAIQSGRVISLDPLAHSDELQDWHPKTDRAGSTANLLFATRCSSDIGFCETGYCEKAEVIAASSRLSVAGAAIFGAFATLLAIASVVLYRGTRTLDRQLRRAIRRGSIEVVYQPVVDLKSRKTLSAEALSRWTDEDGNIVGPDIFIKLAEDGGYIGGITRHVITRVLHDFSVTMMVDPSFRVNVNVSVHDLRDPGFISFLDEILNSYAVSPHSLGIEITESATAPKESIAGTVRILKSKGFRIFIDDFGTGYSSLAYLAQLAPHAIKIDRTFTWAIGTDAPTMTILPQIFSIAEALDLHIVAEGIENSLQAEFYEIANIPIHGQGWYFSRPVSAHVFKSAQLAESEEAALKSV